MLRAKKGQQNVPTLKVTTGLCSSRYYYSMTARGPLTWPTEGDEGIVLILQLFDYSMFKVVARDGHRRIDGQYSILCGLKQWSTMTKWSCSSTLKLRFARRKT